MQISKKGSDRSRGDLKIIWDVRFPTTLSSAQKDTIRNALS